MILAQPMRMAVTNTSLLRVYQSQLFLTYQLFDKINLSMMHFGYSKAHKIYKYTHILYDFIQLKEKLLLNISESLDVLSNFL